MKLKLVCPACKRVFGFERTNLGGIWQCVYCRTLFHEPTLLAKDGEASKEYEDVKVASA